MADNNNGNGNSDLRSSNLRDSEMMAHLLDALEEGTDIGHFGRLVFVMVARHFEDKPRLLELLAQQPGMDEHDARALLLQVEERDYNPPRREQILGWQEQQDFPICPTPDDPAACNVYSELRFPEDIYENIDDYWEERVEAEIEA